MSVSGDRGLVWGEIRGNMMGWEDIMMSKGDETGIKTYRQKNIIITEA